MLGQWPRSIYAQTPCQRRRQVGPQDPWRLAGGFFGKVCSGDRVGELTRQALLDLIDIDARREDLTLLMDQGVERLAERQFAAMNRRAELIEPGLRRVLGRVVCRPFGRHIGRQRFLAEVVRHGAAPGIGRRADAVREHSAVFR